VLALTLLAGCAITIARPAGVSAGTDNVIVTVNLTSDEPDANTGDSVCDIDLGTGGEQCTLRAAIQQANAYPGTDADVIRFGIPGNGVHQIAPSDYLPDITGATEIDGYSQPGASPNTRKLGHGDNAELRIVLSGKTLDPMNGAALTFDAGSETGVVRGLCINRFATALILKSPATVIGNFLGTDASGTKDRGNTFGGIFTTAMLGTRIIGGPSTDARNVIAGNGGPAIISNVSASVQGNYIGVASDGSPMGNGKGQYADAQVILASDSMGNVVGGPGGAANVIAHNEGKGVALINTHTVATIQRNRIFANGGIPIDLGDDGRTANDLDDADMGANRLLNFPVLKDAVTRAGHTTIHGVYRSTPAVAPYGIEFFANPRHTRQAMKYIGFVHVETGNGGKAKFKFDATALAPGKTVTATALDDGGATSELSRPVRVRRP
jgi:CSLREA domain-containing protein